MNVRSFPAAVAAGALMLAAMASPSGPFDSEGANDLQSQDAWKLSVAGGAWGTDDAIERQTDNISLLSHLNVGSTSDMQLQRREGEQIIDGEVVDTTLDIAVMGSVGPNGLRIVDVTDPENPTLLSEVACGAFHNDVVVWQNIAVLGHDGSGTCEQDAQIKVGAPAGKGVWIFDITDPVNPELIRFVGAPFMPRGPHNISVHPEEGLLYFSYQALGDVNTKWGYFDLKDPASMPVTVDMRALEPESGDSCHDMGIALDVESALGTVQDLLFCAGVTATYIWNIDDPKSPQPLGDIVNPAINIHHGARLAPDGKTLVVDDELAGAGTGSAGCKGGAPTGAQWFYDISVPEAPVLLAYSTTSELDAAKMPCTSHFYNFIPTSDGSLKLVTGWYHSGVIVHDFSDLPVPPTEEAYILPEGANFWTAYAWHGKVFGSSYAGGDTAGLYVFELDGQEDLPPSPYDEGTSWARWDGLPGA